ncbi:Os06g0278450, partial [Oryza sativa Japonica Group]
RGAPSSPPNRRHPLALCSGGASAISPAPSPPILELDAVARLHLPWVASPPHPPPLQSSIVVPSPTPSSAFG